MEIERKYLVAKLPARLEEYPHSEIEQCYLSTNPTLRIREMDDQYILTIKIPLESKCYGTIRNIEEELHISAEQYNNLKMGMIGYPIVKTRYRIPLSEDCGMDVHVPLIAEVDVFHSRNEGLALVEVEFPSDQTAINFVPPDWFGKDVSLDPIYRNAYLATQ